MSTSTTARVRSRLAASVVALAFLGLTTACGERSALDQPAHQPAPQVQPSGNPATGFPPPVRNGSERGATAVPGGPWLGRDRVAQRRVAQHETRYHGSPGSYRP